MHKYTYRARPVVRVPYPFKESSTPMDNADELQGDAPDSATLTDRDLVKGLEDDIATLKNRVKELLLELSNYQSKLSSMEKSKNYWMARCGGEIDKDLEFHDSKQDLNHATRELEHSIKLLETTKSLKDYWKDRYEKEKKLNNINLGFFESLKKRLIHWVSERKSDHA